MYRTDKSSYKEMVANVMDGEELIFRVVNEESFDVDEFAHSRMRISSFETIEGLAVNVEGIGGAVSVFPYKEIYVPGEEVTITAYESGELTFAEWTDDLAGHSLSTTFNINEHVDGKALFRKQYNIKSLEFNSPASSIWMRAGSGFHALQGFESNQSYLSLYGTATGPGILSFDWKHEWEDENDCEPGFALLIDDDYIFLNEEEVDEYRGFKYYISKGEHALELLMLDGCEDDDEQWIDFRNTVLVENIMFSQLLRDFEIRLYSWINYYAGSAIEDSLLWANLDVDGDGLTGFEEVAFGSDPFLADERFVEWGYAWNGSELVPAFGFLRTRFEGVIPQGLEFSSDLSNWKSVTGDLEPWRVLELTEASDWVEYDLSYDENNEPFFFRLQTLD